MSYKFDDSDKSVQPVPVIITEGKYEGVKIQYGKVAFNEQDDSLSLKFDYNLMNNPNSLDEDQEFIDTLGDILIAVLEEEIEDVGEDFLRKTEVNEDS